LKFNFPPHNKKNQKKKKKITKKQTKFAYIDYFWAKEIFRNPQSFDLIKIIIPKKQTQMLKLDYQVHQLIFKFKAGTSRGILETHRVYILSLYDEQNPQRIGKGEAAPLPFLSIDYLTDFEDCIQDFCNRFNIQQFEKAADISDTWIEKETINLPSICFAIETAVRDWDRGGNAVIFDNQFASGELQIPINGLVWMENKDFMLQQIDQKLQEGYQCIKLKVGAIDFQSELELLEHIRKQYKASQITLRLDANGAFSPKEAMSKLEKIAQYDIHSIEQPIKAGQWKQLKQLCLSSPIPIALDEELIGIVNKKELLEAINPPYIILKPTLLGGIKATQEWINLADSMQIQWWFTSALESNIGLNAICQFAAEYKNSLPQGLGTGQLYTNNFPSLLQIDKGYISTSVNKVEN
jgi:o-succinylbenzoate synthase